MPVALVVGGSRGIGRQVAIDLAASGYQVVVAGKSTSASDSAADRPFPPDPNSPASTITTVVREIVQAGGHATAIPVDVRSPESINFLVSQTITQCGGIDALVYNAGAIWWSSVEKTPLKRFQLMQRVNPEGLYACVQACLPHFAANGWKGRVVVVCPPIYSRFFRGKTAYAMGKVGMSVLVKGLGMDWEREGKEHMAIMGIWPAAAIESAATADAEERDLRKATIFSQAILRMLAAPASSVNGELFADEDYLRDHHEWTDFSEFALFPGSSPRRIMPKEFPSLRVAEQNDEGDRKDSTLKRAQSKL